MESIVRAFIDSKLTPLAILAALCLGVFAIVATPREEEPQIVVPMIDVFVEMPGAAIKEMEQRVTIPMEKKLAEIQGVEYIYSTTAPGLTMAIVRFYVGENEEDAIVRLYNKLYSNFDLIPAGASRPLIKPRSIDDVPILSLTLWSERYDHFTLRRIAAELDDAIKDISDVAATQLRAHWPLNPNTLRSGPPRASSASATSRAIAPPIEAARRAKGQASAGRPRSVMWPVPTATAAW